MYMSKIAIIGFGVRGLNMFENQYILLKNQHELIDKCIPKKSQFNIKKLNINQNSTFLNDSNKAIITLMKNLGL